MTTARLMQMTATVLLAGLLTHAPCAVCSAAAAQESRPNPTTAVPTRTQSTDGSRVTVQAEIVDPDGRQLTGTEVAVLVWYSRGSFNRDIDPWASVSLVESLAPPRGSSMPIPIFEARLRLAEMLGRSPKERWAQLYRFAGQVPLDD
jgi:hypothetical protein